MPNVSVIFGLVADEKSVLVRVVYRPYSTASFVIRISVSVGGGGCCRNNQCSNVRF